MSTNTVKVTLEFTQKEIESLRPFFYIDDDVETQLTNFIWETIIEKTNVEPEEVYPICIYKSSTGQYTEDECKDDNCVTIHVPEHLLVQWFKDDKCWNQDIASQILEDIPKWVYRESTCEETEDLYDWLNAHGYEWKR